MWNLKKYPYKVKNDFLPYISSMNLTVYTRKSLALARTNRAWLYDPTAVSMLEIIFDKINEIPYEKTPPYYIRCLITCKLTSSVYKTDKYSFIFRNVFLHLIEEMQKALTPEECESILSVYSEQDLKELSFLRKVREKIRGPIHKYQIMRLYITEYDKKFFTKSCFREFVRDKIDSDYYESVISTIRSDLNANFIEEFLVAAYPKTFVGYVYLSATPNVTIHWIEEKSDLLYPQIVIQPAKSFADFRYMLTMRAVIKNYEYTYKNPDVNQYLSTLSSLNYEVILDLLNLYHGKCRCKRTLNIRPTHECNQKITVVKINPKSPLDAHNAMLTCALCETCPHCEDINGVD